VILKKRAQYYIFLPVANKRNVYRCKEIVLMHYIIY